MYVCKLQLATSSQFSHQFISNVNSETRFTWIQRSNIVVQFSLWSCYERSHMWTSSAQHHIFVVACEF